VDAAGNLYFAYYDAVYKATPAGTVTIAAGGTYGFGGDGMAATAAKLAYPSMALDGAGNIYIGDTYNCRVREVTPDGKIKTIAGNGTCAATGDGGPAISAQLNYPGSIAVDGSGNIYVAEEHRIRKIAAGTGIISTFAGSGGTGGSTADGVQATAAYVPYLLWLTLDRSGNVYLRMKITSKFA